MRRDQVSLWSLYTYMMCGMQSHDINAAKCKAVMCILWGVYTQWNTHCSIKPFKIDNIIVFYIIHLPYRNFSQYLLVKCFVNDLRIFLAQAQVVVLLSVSNHSGGYQLKNVYHSSLLFSGNYQLLELSFGESKFFTILAVANFASTNSNEWFCPVG